MKSITQYIHEELDENIYWLLDKWFMQDEEGKQTFVELVAMCGSKTISVEKIKEKIKDTPFETNVKQFVNFIDGDVHDSDKDYFYVLKKIIEIVSANKSAENKYIKESFKITRNSDISNTRFNTSAEIANFLHESIPGSEMKKVSTEEYPTIIFKTWADKSAIMECNEVYDVSAGKHKLRIGMCVESTNCHAEPGDICFQTAVTHISGIVNKPRYKWNKDSLSGYKPGDDLFKYITEARGVSSHLLNFFTTNKLIPTED